MRCVCYILCHKLLLREFEQLSQDTLYARVIKIEQFGIGICKLYSLNLIENSTLSDVMR